MLRFFLLAFLLAVAFSAVSQTEKGFDLNKKRKFEQARIAFIKDTLVDKKSAAAFYGLAKTYEPVFRDSLNSAILANYYVQTADSMMAKWPEAIDFAKKFQVTRATCKAMTTQIPTLAWAGVERRKSFHEIIKFRKSFPSYYTKYKQKIETAAWNAAVKSLNFETLEQIRQNFEGFFDRDTSKIVKEKRRTIAKYTYDYSEDYKTISIISKHYIDCLYENNMALDLNLDSRLIESFVDDFGVPNLKKFREEQPNHWVSSTCWAKQTAAALTDGNLKNILGHFEKYPLEYLNYYPISWYLWSTYRHNEKVYDTLGQREAIRLREIIDTYSELKLLDNLSYQPDSIRFSEIVKSGAPSWRSFVLLQKGFKRCISHKNWSLARWLITTCQPMFPNIEPESCQFYYYTWQEWFEKMKRILSTPYEPLIPRALDELNTNGDESVPIPFMGLEQNTLYFTGADRPDGLNKEDPYEVTFKDNVFGKPKLVSGLAGDKNESILSLTVDGKEALLFIDGVLHTSQKSEFGWSKPVEIAAINKKFAWVGKACLSAEGSVLVFEASEKQLRYGANPNVNLYVSFRDEHRQWQTPFPLPDNINTSFKERSPYLALDGKTLYFSSNGHISLGEMDVYKTTRLDDTWKKWSEPENLGIEINTVKDDWGFNFSVTADGKTAYFSQEDVKGKKKNELMVTGLPPKMRPFSVKFIEVVVPSHVKSVDVKDRNNALIRTVPVYDGRAVVAVETKKEEEILMIAPSGYGVISNTVEVNAAETNQSIVRDTVFKANTVEELQKSNEVFQIPDVHFDKGKDLIKPGAAVALNKFYESIKGEKPRLFIVGHTDNVGSESANLKLSKDRAISVKNYLVKLGYAASRIEIVGRGWLDPEADNLTEENRAKNRRVEFQFVK